METPNFSDTLPPHTALTVSSQTVLVFRSEHLGEMEVGALQQAVLSYFEDPPMIVLLGAEDSLECWPVEEIATYIGLDTAAVAEARQAYQRLSHDIRDTDAFEVLGSALGRVLGG